MTFRIFLIFFLLFLLFNVNLVWRKSAKEEFLIRNRIARANAVASLIVGILFQTPHCLLPLQMTDRGVARNLTLLIIPITVEIADKVFRWCLEYVVLCKDLRQSTFEVHLVDW